MNFDLVTDIQAEYNAYEPTHRWAKKKNLNYMKPIQKNKISSFLELVRPFKVLLKDSTKKRGWENVNKNSWLFLQKSALGEF